MSRRTLWPVLLLALAASATLAGWELRDVATIAPTQTSTLVLSASRPLTQQFTGAYSGLQAIDVLVQPGSSGPSTLVLELYDRDGTLLRAAEAQPNMPGVAWLTFRFPELPTARGRHLTFRLLAPEARYRDGLAVWLSATPLPGHGRLHIGEQRTETSLVYRPHYRPTALELLVVYTQRVAQAHAGPLAYPAAYGGLVFMYLLALAAIVVLLGRFVRTHLGSHGAAYDE